MIDRKGWEEYLIRLYFGNRDDLLHACISRAYRDFNRTGHGLSRLENKGALYTQASDYLRQTFSDIQQDKTNVSNQEQFDRWHQATCGRLAECYINHGYNTFSIGQAQKWINMTFKYIFTMGDNRLPDFYNLYKLCHIPIDNIVLDELRKEAGFPGLTCAWSRLDDYGKYLSCQKWIRERFPSDAPLDIEFRMWMIGADSNRQKRPPVQMRTEEILAKDSDTKGRSIGPYRRDRIVLCSADAKSQAATACEAAYFFPKAKWVGAVRNAANSLGCKFVILTTAHGMIKPDKIIDPYDLKAEDNKEYVAEIWRNTVPQLLGNNQYDLIVFYAGGVPRQPYLDLFLPILRDMKIDFITFGRPNMYDSGKIGSVVKKTERGSSIDGLKTILNYPEWLLFVPWMDDDTKM